MSFSIPNRRVALIAIPALILFLSSYLVSQARQPVLGISKGTPPPDAEITASIGNGDITVKLVLINHASTAFPLLKWNLPEDGTLENALFEVSRDGDPLGYTGRLAKRRVTPESYMPMEPGKKYKATINLGNFYDTGPSGVYEIRYRVFNENEAGDLLEIASPQITVEK